VGLRRLSPHGQLGGLLLLASCVPAAGVGRPARLVAAPAPALVLELPEPIPAPTATSSRTAFAPSATERAAPPFHLARGDAVQVERATGCLTAAIYYEARSEGEEGQRAVAQVVLNRVRHGDYPSTICGVVYQRVRGRPCQFSFVCDGSMRARREPAAWAEARRIAGEALSGSVYAPVGTATHYHTRAVSPGWGRRLAQVVTIGAHIFYQGRNAAPGGGLVRSTASPEALAARVVRERAPAPPPRRPQPAVRPARTLPAPVPAREAPAPGFAFLSEDLPAAPALGGGAVDGR
jgi:spore germination cell wall hydrolase CwlJ-like protein